jgi:DNA-directed RNA polymerase subunit beta
MNIGQVLKRLGWAALRLGFRAITPVFDGTNVLEIEPNLTCLDDGSAWTEVMRDAWKWVLLDSI